MNYILIVILDNTVWDLFSLSFFGFFHLKCVSTFPFFDLTIFRPWKPNPQKVVEYHRRQSIRNCNEAYLWKFDENRKLNKNNPLWRRPKAVNRNYSIFRITNCGCCCRCCCRCYCYWISIRFWFVVKSWFHRQRFLLFTFSF